MNTLFFLAGLVLGFFLGIGAAIFYLRWKMKKQLGNLEQQMGQMMDISEGLEEEVEEKDGKG